MIGSTKIYSSYLVQPRVLPGRAAQWKGFRTQFFEVKRANPHLLRNTVAILTVWVAVIATVQTVTAPAAARLASTTAILPAAGAPTAASVKAPAAASAARPTTLPGGPSGQLLPAGSIAPFGTYKNSYAWGQCTWYVAGRRQIPANWGNANSWYYHAVNTGWKVGTVPAVAAVAWTGAGYYGHVAVVEQVSSNGRDVYVSEMNYHGVGVKSYRWAPATSFKYIY